MTLHDDFAEILGQCGLPVLTADPLSGTRRAPNPTRITISQGRRSITYDVFLWRITHEGKGRSGDNWRIQGTSFGQKNSTVDITPTTLGLGWHEAMGVYVAFDPWVKRSPGSSSSVHIRDDLLQAARSAGAIATAHGDHTWDPRFAFTPPNSAGLFEWTQRLWAPKDVHVAVVDYSQISPDKIVAEADPRPNASPNAAGVRPGDRISICDEHGRRLTEYFWRVVGIEIKDLTPNGGRNRIHYLLEADKSARLASTP